MAVTLDVWLGVPVIYTTFMQYDELAHHFGPSSRQALIDLKRTDARIREIWRMALATSSRIMLQPPATRGTPRHMPMLIGALQSQDMYLAGSFLMFLASLTVVGVFLSDLALAALDPRIRLEGGIRR